MTRVVGGVERWSKTEGCGGLYAIAVRGTSIHKTQCSDLSLLSSRKHHTRPATMHYRATSRKATKFNVALPRQAYVNRACKCVCCKTQVRLPNFGERGLCSIPAPPHGTPPSSIAGNSPARRGKSARTCLETTWRHGQPRNSYASSRKVALSNVSTDAHRALHAECIPGSECNPAFYMCYRQMQGSVQLKQGL